MSKFDRKEIYIRNNYWKRKKISPRKKFFSLFWTILFSRLKRPLTHISVFLISSTFRENIFFRMKILFRSMNHGKFFFFQFPLFFFLLLACGWRRAVCWKKRYWRRFQLLSLATLLSLSCTPDINQMKDEITSKDHSLVKEHFVRSLLWTILFRVAWTLTLTFVFSISSTFRSTFFLFQKKKKDHHKVEKQKTTTRNELVRGLAYFGR